MGGDAFTSTIYLLALIFAATLFVVTTLARFGRIGAHDSDPNSPRVLARFNSDIQAQFLVNELIEQGIHARLVGEYTSGFRAEAPGDVRIVVPLSELHDAQAKLERIQERLDDEDNGETE